MATSSRPGRRVLQICRQCAVLPRDPAWRLIPWRLPTVCGGVAVAGLAAAAAASTYSGKRLAALCEDEEGVLPGSVDAYGGLRVDPNGLPSTRDAFAVRLDASLSTWKQKGVRGVWLQVPIQKSDLISTAVDRGFVFHHAEKDHCVMTNWLPVDEPNPLPPNASHQVGVGALVVNDDGKVLFVQEAVGPASGTGMWKIPTGLLHAKEDLSAGVKRELFEEVGLDAEFEKVIVFRHGHAAPFGKSDLFFVCLLRVNASAKTNFNLQKSEIANAKWMDFNEFLEQKPYPKETPLWNELYRRCIGEDGVVGNVPGINAVRLPKFPGGKLPEMKEYIYF